MGSEPTNVEAVPPTTPRSQPLRRFANPGGTDERTIFQPAPARRANPNHPSPNHPGPSHTSPNQAVLERAVGPATDKTAVAAPLERTIAPRRATEEAADLSLAHENPLMQAASPLLLLFGRLRTSLVRAPSATLMPQIVQSILRAEAEMRAAGVSTVTVERAKYLISIAADEVLSNLPGADVASANTRANNSIVRHFFGEHSKADRIFTAIETRSSEDRDLIELQHACLALVFIGNSRVLEADAAKLQTLRHELYTRLQASGGAVEKSLSPRWKGLALPAPHLHLKIPFWAVIGVVGMLLFALYLMLRGLLGLEADSLAQTMRALTPQTFAQHNDMVAAPPTPAQTTQFERIRKVLAQQIAEGYLSVEPTANQIIIRIPDRVIFPPERASVLNDFIPVAQRVALAIDQEQGQIKIIGHSDNAALNGGRYASNFQLSLDQAKAVASLIRRSLSEPDRVVAEGKGADVPLASNDTPEGRAKNRRIEVVIARSN